MQPLRGVKVLDFSRVLAGPLCTQALADLGASVIKVESCEGGDDTRSWPPMREAAGTLFHSVNRGKRSLALDLKSARGRQIAQSLIERSDVLVESFGHGVADRLGIGWDDATRHNPRLIHCSISGYGASGPLKSSKGYDMMLQAFSGMVSVMGEPDGGPVRAPFSPVDQGTGMHATSGILAALIERGRTGTGVRVQISLYETSIAYMNYLLQASWQRGAEPQKYACAHESLCPYQVFEASDKALMIGVGNDGLWRKLCATLDLQSLADDPDFATNPARVRNRDWTVAAVQSAIARGDCEHWTRVLTDAGIPNSPINGLLEAGNHPHTEALGLVGTLPGVAGESRFVRSPLSFDGNRPVAQLPPPRLGEHSREILAEIGCSAQDIGGLFETGVCVGPEVVARGLAS